MLKSNGLLEKLKNLILIVDLSKLSINCCILIFYDLIGYQQLINNKIASNNRQ